MLTPHPWPNQAMNTSASTVTGGVSPPSSPALSFSSYRLDAYSSLLNVQVYSEWGINLITLKGSLPPDEFKLV